MNLYFYFKKFQNFFIKKSFLHSKIMTDFYFTGKKKTIVSFSSIGRGRRYIQQNEFFDLTNKYNVLFVKDITRSWFNNIEIKYFKSYLKKNINSIGFSMGGFNAIIFSSLYPVDKVIAFSPQFSIHPNISKDKTFINFAALIKKWKFPQLRFSKKTKYLLIFGDSENEKYHMKMIPKMKNIKILIIKNCDHKTALYLKKKNKLKKIISTFFDEEN